MNKFNQKKSPKRKFLSLGHNNMNANERATEFGMDYQYAHMELNSGTFYFNTSNGSWSNGELFLNIDI
jgi:hypothetical protein